MTPTKTLASERVKPAAQNAIALLKAGHEVVGRLFAKYEKVLSVPGKKALVAEICTALSVHAQIKKEIFYPELKSALQHEGAVREATVENWGVTDLIAQLRGVEPHGEMYDAKVMVLSEHVKQHVKEEQYEMFPMVEASSLDMVEVGARMTARQEDLLTQELQFEPGPQGATGVEGAR